MAVKVGSGGKKRHYVKKPTKPLKSSEASKRNKKKACWWEILLFPNGRESRIRVNGPRKAKTLSISEFEKQQRLLYKRYK